MGVLLLHSHENKQKYRLFAARDKFLLLAAANVLPETDMVFKVFYRAMNIYIAELDSVILVSFLRASIAVRTELEKQNQKRLSESLRRSDPQVQAVVEEFFQAVMDALRYNSPMLNLMLGFAHHCTTILIPLRRLFPRLSLPLYDTYRYYETIQGTLCLA